MKKTAANVVPIRESGYDGGDLLKVISSSVAAVGYDRDRKILRVRFRDAGVMQFSKVTDKQRTGDQRTYDYFQVPEPVFGELMAAQSKGQFIARYVKNCFGYAQVDDKEFQGEPVKAARAVTAAQLKPSGECWAALERTHRMMKMKSDHARLPYLLWTSCGRPDTKNGEDRRTKLYKKCLLLIAEASGCNTIGGEFVAAAMKLAAGRGE